MMSESLPAILMLPPHGSTQVEGWVAEGRLAAASDLVCRLLRCKQFSPIIIIAEDANDEAALAQLGAIPWEREAKPFHFGNVLAACLRAHRFKRFGYFGGASAPLLQEAALTDLAMRFFAANSPMAITNNLHSSDWFLTNEVESIQSFQDQFPSDNPLGWVYTEHAGVDVRSELPSAATRLDIDTPMDLAMIHGHQAVGPHLSQFLKKVPSNIQERVQSIREVLNTKAKNITIIGRASSHLWHQLEEQTQIWVRLVVEERGMVASQRLARGEVNSLVASLIHVLGAEAFIESLEQMTDAVIWDTRVWMAAELGWPRAADRFASDLGQVDEIQDTKLRNLTNAINEAEIPILAGGYGVVSGGLYALLESIRAG